MMAIIVVSCFLLLSLFSQSQSSSLSAVVEKCKPVMSKKILFTTTIGFSSPNDELLETKIFEENDDIVSLSCDEPSALLEVGVSDVTIILTKMIELRGDRSLLLAKFQAFLEATIKTGKSAKLFVIVKDYTGDDVKTTVNQVLVEAYSLLPSSLRNSDRLSPLDLIDVTAVSVNTKEDSSMQSLAGKIRATVGEGDGSLTGAQVVSKVARLLAMQTKAATSKQPESYEQSSTDACSLIVESLLKDVRTRVGALTSSSNATDIANIVAEALSRNFAGFHDLFTDYATTSALSAASFRAKASLLTTLQPVYRRMLESLRSSCTRSFESAILRVPPNSRLVSGLRAQAANAQSTFMTKAEELRTVFSRILDNTESPSLVGGGPWSRRLGSASSFWSTGGDLQTLCHHLAEACADRERQLFLQGAYNPYVRDKPIPPTKLSFHYLLDPRAVAFNRGYDPLYDEQRDGPAETRAAGLHVPGLATLPFDPNEHAVPKDNTPWWQTLIDFYGSD